MSQWDFKIKWINIITVRSYWKIIRFLKKLSKCTIGNYNAIIITKLWIIRIFEKLRIIPISDK
jgi:hypothetical protein